MDGAYRSGSHATGFTGIIAASSMPSHELSSWLDGSANADHDFSMFLEAEQIAMLVSFIQDGLVDVSSSINADKTVNGDPVNGKKLYEASCQHCHGEDGVKINFGSKNEPEFVGTVAAGNPWEFLHKVSFGQPGEHMPSGVNLGFSVQDRADIASHAQAFSTE